jgi:pyruvate dehydrogenase E2 component (dihydrolipoamide acetyltransferase)
MNVLMPQLGETVAEGKITKWFKSAGEAVKPGDNLFEIETDKVSMEVPATTDGVLSEIRVAAGEVALVGAVVGVIADGAGAAASPPAAPRAPAAPSTKAADDVKPSQQPGAAPAPRQSAHSEQHSAPGEVGPRPPLDPFFEVRTPERNYGPARLPGGTVVTPLARRLAGDAGIDLSAVRGSGPHGRIIARDVETAPRPAGSRAGARTEGPSAAEIKALYAPDSYDEVALDDMRRSIANRLTPAAIPQFYLATDVEIGRMVALREEANRAAPKDADGKPAFKLSINDFIIRALALALQRVPAANAVWTGDSILRFRHSDIGVAVALDNGFAMPIVRSAETKSLTAISAAIKNLAARSRDRALEAAAYRGGATAVTNLGMHQVRGFSAIIVPPHSSILAVGAAHRQAIEKADGGVEFVSVLRVTLSCDHRVIDGALGAELLAAFKALLESPVAMLV